MAILDDVVLQLKAVGKAAVDAVQSDTIRKVADLIDQVHAVNDQIQDEIAKLGILTVPPKTEPPKNELPQNAGTISPQAEQTPPAV